MRKLLQDLPRVPDWWTAGEVAEYADISEHTINVYIRRGEMPPPSHRIGGSRVWRPEVIRRWQAGRPNARANAA